MVGAGSTGAEGGAAGGTMGNFSAAGFWSRFDAVLGALGIRFLSSCLSAFTSFFAAFAARLASLNFFFANLKPALAVCAVFLAASASLRAAEISSASFRREWLRGFEVFGIIGLSWVEGGRVSSLGKTPTKAYWHVRTIEQSLECYIFPRVRMIPPVTADGEARLPALTMARYLNLTVAPLPNRG